MHLIRPERRPEPRRVVIDGQVAIEMVRRPPLPQRLDQLLAAPGMRVFPITIHGWRDACESQVHRLMPIAEGRYRGPDLVVRDLRVLMCCDCEAVCVRDVSLDTLEAYDPTGRGFVRPTKRAPRRRDLVLAWYTGARRRQREYR